MIRILIVEDDLDLRQSLSYALALAGFEVAEAEDGQVGFQMALEFLPQAIISDLQMPNLDGYELLSRIRKETITAPIPFIFLTVSSKREDIRKAMSLGADDFVIKPFEMDDLLATLKAQLDKKALFDRDQIQMLSRRLVAIQERERRQVARQLNDEIHTRLTSLKFALEMQEPGGQSLYLMEELLEQVWELSVSLRPAMLDHLGLLTTITWYIERFTTRTMIQVHFTHDGLRERFPATIETATFRIVQEGLENISRHAGTGAANLHIESNETQITILLIDHGGGFDLETVLQRKTSGGLASMWERALSLGGTLSIDTASGKGTRLSAVLPLDPLKMPPPSAAITTRLPEFAKNPLSQLDQTLPKKSISIMLAVGGGVTRAGMSNLLGSIRSFTVLDTIGDDQDILANLMADHPDVLIFDIELSDAPLQVLVHIRDDFPLTQVVVLSLQGKQSDVAMVMQSGAIAYVLKRSMKDSILQAVYAAVAGRRYLCPILIEEAVGAYLEGGDDGEVLSFSLLKQQLTSREIEVLLLVVSGFKNAEIAAELVISKRTVETHRANIMRKLGLRNQADLIRYAVEQGILSTAP